MNPPSPSSGGTIAFVPGICADDPGMRIELKAGEAVRVDQHREDDGTIVAQVVRIVKPAE
jgi:hypothetical protein